MQVRRHHNIFVALCSAVFRNYKCAYNGIPYRLGELARTARHLRYDSLKSG